MATKNLTCQQLNPAASDDDWQRAATGTFQLDIEEEPFGMGGQAAVHRAFGAERQQWALKLYWDDVQAWERARDEFYGLQAAGSGAPRPHRIVYVPGWKQREACIGLLVELIEGEPLSSVVDACRRRNETLPAVAVGRLGLRLLEILEAFHKHRNRQGPFVHCDVKPSNVILPKESAKTALSPTRFEHARLIDFGLVRINDAEKGQFRGTPGYSPIEQLRGKAPEPAWDLFALSVTLAECFGRQPSTTPTVTALAGIEHLPSDWRSLTREALPAWRGNAAWNTFFQRTLGAGSAERMPDVSEYRRLLERAVGVGPLRWWLQATLRYGVLPLLGLTFLFWLISKYFVCLPDHGICKNECTLFGTQGRCPSTFVCLELAEGAECGCPKDHQNDQGTCVKLGSSQNCRELGDKVPGDAVCVGNEIRCNRADRQVCHSSKTQQNVCVDTKTDRENCGQCQKSCNSSESCIDGRCTDTCDKGTAFYARCPPDWTCTTVTNAERCGASCAPCPSPRTCQLDTDEQRMVCACLPGTVFVGDQCVDPRTDPLHCGAVDADLPGRQCGGGRICKSGSCDCADGTAWLSLPVAECAPGIAPGDCGICVDLASDPRLGCAKNAKACRQDQICESGKCACPSGYVECGQKCEPRERSKCDCSGETCKPFQQCINESCTCPKGYTKDGSASGCLSDEANDSHCGTLGTDCTQTNSRCIRGKCSCPKGQAEIGDNCVKPCAHDETMCSSKCVVVSKDRSNCGSCGKACSSSETCEAGVCRVLPAGTAPTVRTPTPGPSASSQPAPAPASTSPEN